MTLRKVVRLQFDQGQIAPVRFLAAALFSNS